MRGQSPVRECRTDDPISNASGPAGSSRTRSTSYLLRSRQWNRRWPDCSASECSAAAVAFSRRRPPSRTGRPAVRDHAGGRRCARQARPGDPRRGRHRPRRGVRPESAPRRRGGRRQRQALARLRAALRPPEEDEYGGSDRRPQRRAVRGAYGPRAVVMMRRRTDVPLRTTGPGPDLRPGDRCPCPRHRTGARS